MQYKSTGCQITTVDKTTDKLTGRGGLSFILRYLEKIKFFNLAAETLPETRDSNKAKSVKKKLLKKLGEYWINITIRIFNKPHSQ